MELFSKRRNRLFLLVIILGAVLLTSGTAFCADLEEKQVITKDRFKDNKDGTVLDASTGLMWAAKDNDGDINWADAEAFCKEYNAGGYDDWRLPSLDELKTLYDGELQKTGVYGVTPLITLSNCCPWTSIVNLNSAAVFSFKTGNKPWSFLDDDYQLRALPVRGKPEDESVKSKAFTGR